MIGENVIAGIQEVRILFVKQILDSAQPLPRQNC